MRGTIHAVNAINKHMGDPDVIKEGMGFFGNLV